MKDKAIIFVMFMAWVGVNEGVNASPSIPTEADQVVASWAVPEVTDLSDQQRLALAIEHLDQSTQALQIVDHADRAAKQLERIRVNDHNRLDYLYAKARLEQHRHQFDQALRSLDSLIALNPRHGGAWLMRASILAINGEFNAAHEACKKTFGLLDASLSIVCSLDIKGLQGDVAGSYATLSSIAHSLTFDGVSKEWLVQVLASQALRLHKYEEAIQWIDRLDFNAVSLATIALWSDAHLKAGHGSKVRQVLESMVQSRLSEKQSVRYVDDALLVRLAIASKHDQGALWPKLLDRRVSLRLQLEDDSHMAELARYFIDVRPNSERALFWAQRNWAESKLHEDHIILKAAQDMKEVKS